MAVILGEITDRNREAVALRVAPGQERFVGSVRSALAEAAARHQGRGYGSQVVRQVAELVRAEGATELLTSYVPEDGGPAAFYERLGFVPSGQLDMNGEVIARLVLP